MRIIVILFVVAILASLGSALYYLVTDRGGASTRTVRALTWRVALSVTLFALLMLGFHFGIITTKL